MENVEVVCVEVQENENGEIVCVNKMDSADTSNNYCVMECEIAPNGPPNDLKSDEENPGSPVEIIVFPNFQFCDEPITVVEETCVTEGQENEVQSLVSSCQSEYCGSEENEDSELESQGNASIVLKVMETNSSDVNTEYPLEQICRDTRERSATSTANVYEKNPNPLLENHSLWTVVDKKDNKIVPKDYSIVSPGSLVRKKYSGPIPKRSETVKSSHGKCFSQLPFQCKVCDKSFRQDSSLKIHLKVHAGKYSDICRLS